FGLAQQFQRRFRRAPLQLDPRTHEQQRRAPESALELLREAEALLPGASEPRELALRLAAVRANAATSSGDFPLAAQALDTADALAATAAERSSLTVQRARLLSARGRDAEASSLLRSVAADTLPQLHEDDPLTAQIRAQLAGLDSTARASAVPHDAPDDATSLAARLDAFSRNLERARAEAGIDAPALAVDAASQQAVRTATVPASAPAASDGTPAQLLATDISRACELNTYGRYREAAQLLDVALERQRSDPALRHGDDYRLGALAAAVARHGTAPTPDSALRLSHELARDVWLTTDASRARWREQTAIARRLGVERAE
ncbi:MAG TPA: hypothetical protein VLF18_04655, partial [Tahibacter sp.]|uniref:hypothetical protein n=1 Tax=Tahibacter sp. TaxID=2056211 RepID=UPI002CB4E6F7